MTYGDVFDFAGAPGGIPLGRGAPASWGDFGGNAPIDVTPCPVCGASCSDGTIGYRNIDGPEPCEGNHGGVWQRADCSDCGASWAECYYLLGALVDERPTELDGFRFSGAFGGFAPSGQWESFYRVADGSLLDRALAVVELRDRQDWDALPDAIEALRESVELFGARGVPKVRGAGEVQR